MDPAHSRTDQQIGSEAPHDFSLGRLMRIPGAIALAGLAFILKGCSRSPSESGPKATGSPPENPNLVFTIPTPEQMRDSIKAPFRGTAPEDERQMEVYSELLQLAAFHPLGDWKFFEEPRSYNGYLNAAWGGREYRLHIGDRLYRVCEEVEHGYDGRMVAATATLVVEGSDMGSDGSGGLLRLYCNDDWGTLPFKILEERFDLAERRLSWRTPFMEIPMRPEAWSMPIVHVPNPPQPAPLAVVTMAELPSGYGDQWKGKGPRGTVEEFIYVQASNLAGVLPIDQWKFTESITDNFGNLSAVWGYRRYETQVDYRPLEHSAAQTIRNITIEEEVRHNGDHLESHCSIIVVDAEGAHGPAKESLRVEGGWAEVLCQCLETRYFLAHGILPRRVPFITTPTTPGSFIRTP